MKYFFYLLVAGCLWGCPPPSAQTETAIKISANVSVEGFSQQIMVSNAFFFFAEMRLVSDVNVEGQEISAEQIISSQAVSNFSFADAPPALYSRLQIKLKKPRPDTKLPPEFQEEPLSLLIEGDAQISGALRVPFRIKTDKPSSTLNIVFSQGIDLLPGNTAQISLRGDISRAFEGVSFEDIDTEDLTDGVFLLDLRDGSFLDEHPAAEVIAEQITENIEQVFSEE